MSVDAKDLDLTTAEDREEEEYRVFAAAENARVREQEAAALAEARLENERKTADAAYAAALAVIDNTISRAQTYSERMTGMSSNQFSDAQLKLGAQPANLCGELRDYQLEGFRWIVCRAFAGESIILADEMGLGACCCPPAAPPSPCARRTFTPLSAFPTQLCPVV